MVRLKIRRFDPSKIKPDRIIYFIGRRGSGKSTLTEDILSHLAPRLDMALAMSPTEDSLAVFRKHFPEPWLFDGYSEATVEELVEMQKNLARQNKQRSLALVLDDCMYQRNVLRSNAMRNLHFNGRHLHVCFINAVQYLMDIEPSMRSQVDYVFALRETIQSNKMKLWKFFFGIFPNFNDFSKTMDACTKDYSAIVLDCTNSKNTEIEDCIFWYKASLNVPPFKIGKPVFWKMARRYARSDEEVANARRDVEVARTKERRQTATSKHVTVVQRSDEKGRTLREDLESGGIVIE